VIHIWNLDFAGSSPTTLALDHAFRFILTWNKNYHLIGPDGRKPWYLITSEPVHIAEQAWQIIFANARCWQIEMLFRFTKSEMAFESPPLHAGEARLKFLLIVALAFAFLRSAD